MRKTKIICTIGPASAGEEILTRMCRSGMNVAKLNFSHGTFGKDQDDKEGQREAGISFADHA